jgi:hypothetical protein
MSGRARIALVAMTFARPILALGMLLLSTRTRRLGALLLFPVLLNVVMINYFLDLWTNTKMISSVLLGFEHFSDTLRPTALSQLAERANRRACAACQPKIADGVECGGRGRTGCVNRGLRFLFFPRTGWG